ncbi:OsmC family protein [Roseibium marinum]|uniref:OsmC-like protein n=1 Tax=Roseibium marinum TaxID=281252 RepID=A0A2S3UXK0_9HYPH|nr:OsmC family protein [Roseibium marinum]POF32416.1 OsmC-like protein [Roseibium marinum]
MTFATEATIETHREKDARIRKAQNKVIARMRADPEKARSTIATTGRIDAGLACSVRQGKFETRMDFGPGMGGESTGPSPGFFARAAISGCVAMGIKMLAAREGLVFDALEVTVETDFDDAALFELGSSSAAPLETRIGIVIDTQVPEEEVQNLVKRVLKIDPWFLALRDPQHVVSKVSVRPDSAGT